VSAKEPQSETAAGVSAGVAAGSGADSVAPTRRGVHERLAGLDAGRPPRFDPRHTLRLPVEFARQLRRRRTQIAVLILLVLPIIIASAFKIGGGAGTDAPQLVTLATTGASNFVLFVEYASVGFLLVVIVALFCGDTVASEANWSSLRYLLALPVPRARLLRQKLIVALSLSFAANLLLPLWALLVGGVFFGWQPIQAPGGISFDTGQSLLRLLVIVGYICVQSVAFAGLAFLLSVSVDNPLGAVGGATLLVVVSSILDEISALDPYRQYLPTHFQYAWTEALNSSLTWDDMLRGAGVALVYAAVFLSVAWLRFDRKDITS
jgi:ABC-2 type transport system permease protein